MVEDEEKAYEYLIDLFPLIGEVIVTFNALESSLDSILCETFTDRTDSMGLIVLHKMSYSSKKELFKRFSDDFNLNCNFSYPNYDSLIRMLTESGRLRNLVAHANWMEGDEEGYTFINLRINKKGMKQEYVQFTKDSLLKVIDEIEQTSMLLSWYSEAQNDYLYN